MLPLSPRQDLGLNSPHGGQWQTSAKGAYGSLSLFASSRLPILQGGTFAFVAPSLAMLSLPTWKCPEWTLNASLVNTSSPEFTEEWQKRIREVTGQGGGVRGMEGSLTGAPEFFQHSLFDFPLGSIPGFKIQL